MCKSLEARKAHELLVDVFLPKRGDFIGSYPDAGVNRCAIFQIKVNDQVDNGFLEVIAIFHLHYIAGAVALC